MEKRYMSRAEAVALATKHANDVQFRIAAVLKNNGVVVTQQCIEYQLAAGNVVLIINGHWEYVRDEKGFGWKQIREVLN